MKMNSTSSTNGTPFIAYRVFYDPPCDVTEDIGYYLTKINAELAKADFIERRKLSKDGHCCGNEKHVEVEEITISQ